MACEVHFEEKYLRLGEKCTLQWPMNPVPTVPQTILSKPSSLPTQQIIRSLPRKRSFQDELSTFIATSILPPTKIGIKSPLPPPFMFPQGNEKKIPPFFLSFPHLDFEINSPLVLPELFAP